MLTENLYVSNRIITPNIHIVRRVVHCYTVSSDGVSFLLVKRYGGIWEAPGGGVKSGESVVEACIRELEEETGIIVAESQVRQNNHTAFTETPNSSMPIFICSATIRLSLDFDASTTTLNDEHTDFIILNQEDAYRLIYTEGYPETYKSLVQAV